MAPCTTSPPSLWKHPQTDTGCPCRGTTQWSPPCRAAQQNSTRALTLISSLAVLPSPSTDLSVRDRNLRKVQQPCKRHGSGHAHFDNKHSAPHSERQPLHGPCPALLPWRVPDQNANHCTGQAAWSTKGFALIAVAAHHQATAEPACCSLTPAAHEQSIVKVVPSQLQPYPCSPSG